MATNQGLVTSGLQLLRAPLSVYVCQTIANAFGESWWIEGVLETLVYDKTPTVDAVRRYRKLPELGTLDQCASAMDISVCLVLLTKHWPRLFAKELGPNHRGWAYELIGVRNTNSHLVEQDHAADFTWRALDTMYRLCEQIDPVTARALAEIRSAVDLSEYKLTGRFGTDTQSPYEPEPPQRPEHSAPASAARAPETATRASAPIGGTHAVAEDLDPGTLDDLLVAGPDFSGADLRGFDFGGANLAGADFTGADLRKANLTKANLAGAVFSGTRLGDEGARAAQLAGADFTGATLDFSNCDLRYVGFDGLKLDNADFTGADLRKASFQGAKVTRAVFRGTRLGDEGARAAQLAGADFQDTTFDFKDCDLRYANLSGVNLDGADFTGAKMECVNLEGASLRGVNFQEARFTGVKAAGARWA